MSSQYPNSQYPNSQYLNYPKGPLPPSEPLAEFCTDCGSALDETGCPTCDEWDEEQIRYEDRWGEEQIRHEWDK